MPRHFEQATKMVTRDRLKEVVVCGPDPSRYLEAIGTFEAAGYHHICPTTGGGRHADDVRDRNT